MNGNGLTCEHTSRFSAVTPSTHGGGVAGSSIENVLSWACRASSVELCGVPRSDARRLIVVSVGVGKSNAEESVVAVGKDEGKGVDCLPFFLWKPFSMVVGYQGDELRSLTGSVYK